MKKIRKTIICLVAIAICITMGSTTQKINAMDSGSVEKQEISNEKRQAKSLTPTPEEAFSVATSGTLGNYIYKYDVTIGGTEVVIPETIKGLKIQTISTNVFNNKGLTSIYIPDGITEIKDNAFSNNSIQELRLPETLKILGANVFYKNNIETLTIPDSLETMGNAAFSSCGIKNLKLPNNMKTIPSSAFSSNKFVEVVIPDSVESIESMAFKGNLSMTKVHLSENLLTIGTFAFQLGGIEEVYMGNKIQTIGSNAFANNRIKAISLPNSLATIDEYAFSSNRIESVVIPDSVSVLGSHAFAGNTINSLKIGSGITTIPQNCFGNNLLKTIDITANITQIDSNAFNMNSLLSIDLPDTVTTLAADAFGTQKISTGLSKKDGINIKRMSQIYDADQLQLIRNATSNWGTYNSATNEMELTRDLTKDMDIIKYNYHIENSTISSDTALYIRLLFNATYDYQVTFKDSDGSVLKTQYVEYGQAAVAPQQPTPPQNMVFSQWDTNFNSVTSELTVTAVYKLQEYDVHFKNIDDTILSSVKVEHDALVAVPEVPVQTGYRFDGWFQDKNYTTAWNFATNKIIVDTTIYAKWEVNQYTALFEEKGGSEVVDITVDYNTRLGTLPTPTRSGYTFDGWFTSETGGIQISEDTLMPENGATYFARWTAIKYTALFEEKGGSEVADITVDYNTRLRTLPITTKTGYNFDGWFTAETGGSQISEDTLMPLNGATYYARWTAIRYTALFEENGGSTVTDITVDYNTKLGTLPTPSKAGYDFDGWFTEVTGGSQISEDTLMPLNGATYYGRWSVKQYEATFNSNGGNESDSTIRQAYNEKLGLLPVPTKTGYRFNGWFTAETGGSQITGDTLMPLNGATYYAHWTIKEYTATFDEIGGSTVIDITANYNTKLGTLPTTIKSGYTFDGWFTSKTGGNKISEDTLMPENGVTYYARWRAIKYTALFEENGGSTVTDITVDYDTKLGILPTPSKTGFTFDGWFTSETGGNKISEDTLMPLNGATYYARWTAIKYTAIFDETGGSTVTDISVNYNTKLGTLPTTTKSGYTFKGWFTAKTGGTQITEDTLMPLNGVSYYAQWQINQYTVSFDGNGGTNGTDITKNYDEKLGNLPDSQRDGYILDGWFSDRVNGIEINENTKMPENGATYYARWSGVTSAVTFMDGEEIIKSTKVQYDTKYGTLPLLTKTGYIFLGWYSEPNGQGTMILDTTIVKEKQNHIIYAYWKQINFNHSVGSIVVDGGEDVRYDLKIEDQDINIFNQQSNLLSVYDIYFTMNDQRVNIGNKKMTVTLYLKEPEKYFDHYQVVYLDNDGQIVETYTPSVETDYSALTFDVSHLSYYGIVAWDDPEDIGQSDNNQNVDNIKEKDKILTNDTNNIGLYVSLSSVMLLLIAVLLYVKSTNNN